MEYKAISLHQPWASLIALEIKKRETRSWSTKYRGKLLICSTKKKYVPNSELINKIFDLTDIGAFDRRRLDFLGVNTTYTEYLPLGKVLCVVDLTNCDQMTANNGDNDDAFINGERPPLLEWLCGNWQAGRYAWELSNTNRLTKPIPIKGHQGLWIPDDSIIKEVKNNLTRD
ncbi:MAG: hypothetical protein AN483_12885 [Aphanizomenon flos-aquae MDT14a]|jgi:hypothetical protein|uniref:ASCH domain-containing protein n=1 Tax=Aphanizomenon flos-aquae WA102 TaxID=1710896 RepID=A0A1B7X2L2_APHFL|nr:MAG: hypothetical protein AN483_12885 [Aphanizomenon flos-aquae MDT14a]OBQ43605.1 MAG: hypothetical protein AN484_11405 [Aphanizomenon flos-aquae WA102]